MTEKIKHSLSETEAKRIVKDHKVFWTTAPQSLLVDGEIRKVGISVVLAGTDANDAVKSSLSGTTSIFDNLSALANWVIPEETPNVNIELRRNTNFTFYRPDEFEKNLKRYALGIRVMHKEKFDEPFDQDQRYVYEHILQKLEVLECPKEHWKY